MEKGSEKRSSRSPPDVLPIIKTKLFIPPIRSKVVSRPRLVECLEEGMASKHQLLVVSAPAGFGKTTLLCEWVHQTHTPVAWISLDEGDNDLTRFLAYLVAAIQTLAPEAGKTALDMQQSPQPPPMEIVLATFINDLASIEHAFALVLDDYHVIDAPAVHEALVFILDHIPTQMHIFLATRTDPPFPIARLRSRILLTELDESHLRFNRQESATYLNSVMQLDIAEEDIAELENRTEGWIAGLQMAALSIQGRQDVSSFIRSLSGTHRFILDYLVEEVLEKQPPEIQDFILQTSILDRLTAHLCDAVFVGSTKASAATSDQRARNLPDPLAGSQQVLEYMDRSNLFVVPLDEDRRWYRYHRLFAELLKDRLHRKASELVPLLHRRASDWYERQGLIAETVGHAMACGDFERAAELVAKNALAMVYRGKLTTLARWLDAMPEECKKSLPWLSIAHAWALTFAGQLERVAALLLDAEAALATMDDRKEVQRLSGIVDALRAYLVALRGDMALAIEFAREALKLLPEDDLVLTGFTSMLLASLLHWKGELEEAAQAYTQAIAINRQAGDKNVLVESLSDLASLQALQGKLQSSITTCREALSLAEEHFEFSGHRLPAHGLASIRMSVILREWNDLKAARKFALEGLRLCERWGQADFLVRAQLELARLNQASGHLSDAEKALQDAVHVASELSPWYVARTQACEAELLLAQGRLDEALRWADSQPGLPGQLDSQNMDAYLTVARVYLAQAQTHGRGGPSTTALNTAFVLLDSLEQQAEAMGAGAHLLKILVLRAVALEARGESDGALSAISTALTYAEQEGFVRAFIEQGAPIASLLRKAAARGIAVQYVSQLLRALEQEVRPGQIMLGVDQHAMIEALSERELEVLRLLATHLSSTEIANELTLAVSTVRTHIKNIYGKLKVHSRNDAVQRAREIGLL